MGGTVRLPRLIGGLKAMDLILTGRSMNAKAALKAGLVDAVVPLRQALIAARYFVQKKPAVRRATLLEKITI